MSRPHRFVQNIRDFQSKNHHLRDFIHTKTLYFLKLKLTFVISVVFFIRVLSIIIPPCHFIFSYITIYIPNHSRLMHVVISLIKGSFWLRRV